MDPYRSGVKMNLTFVLLSVILFAVILVTYLVNKVNKTNDLKKIHNLLAQSNQYLVAFNLGRNEVTKKFKVATVTSKGDIAVTEEAYPREPSGRLMTLIDHGDIHVEQNGDYKISGINETIRCPSGYGGSTCQILPICEPIKDDGKLKPVTGAIFNNLGLFNTAFPLSRIETSSDKKDYHHPRLRIHCLDNGRYTIENCPQNKLLDDNLNCIPYDICQDHVNGFKHNYPISNNDKLTKNEYYSCVNNSSVRNKCTSEDLIFSNNLRTCITSNQCVGLGNVTIPVDANNYILCKNDQVYKVYCSGGVQKNEDGLLSCVIKTCKEKKVSLDDGNLQYDYGEIKCSSSDKPIIKICDNSPKPYKWRYSWAKEFDVSLDNWPREIYVNGNCREPTLDDGILKNPVIDVKWSDAMARGHPFDLLKKRYVCSTDKPYRWDYQTGKLYKLDPTTGTELEYKLTNKEFVQTNEPCQDKIYSLDQTPWGIGKYETYPPNKPPMIITVPSTTLSAAVGDKTIAINFPFKSKNGFSVFIIEYNESLGFYQMIRYENKVYPAGFELGPKDELQLIGTNYTVEDFWSKVCFISYGGVFGPPLIPENSSRFVEGTMYQPANVELTPQNPMISVMVWWPNMKSDTFDVSDEPGIVLYLNRVDGTINSVGMSYYIGINRVAYKLTDNFDLSIILERTEIGHIKWGKGNIRLKFPVKP